MTPPVVRLVADADLQALPFLLAVAFGSGAGSVATLTGNPQIMIVGTLSGSSPPQSPGPWRCRRPAAASAPAKRALGWL